MERYTASSSLSNVLYRVSAGVIFLEKKEMDARHHCCVVGGQLRRLCLKRLSSGRWGIGGGVGEEGGIGQGILRSIEGSYCGVSPDECL